MSRQWLIVNGSMDDGSHHAIIKGLHWLLVQAQIDLKDPFVHDLLISCLAQLVGLLAPRRGGLSKKTDDVEARRPSSQKGKARCTPFLQLNSQN